MRRNQDNQESQPRKPILQAIPIAQKPLKLSLAIVHYVIRTKQALILNDAPHEGAFQQDHYVRTQQPKSILCMPLINQGQVKALLYLENNLNTGAFTPDRVEVLRLLSSQMTVSLDNARLYNNLEELVLERTTELREAKKEAEALVDYYCITNLFYTLKLGCGTLTKYVEYSLEFCWLYV